MTTTERQYREQIAAEIAAQFGKVSPYRSVIEFVKKGKMG